MSILKQAGLATMTLLLFGADGWADTASLPLTDDAFVIGVRPTSNYGAWDDVVVTSYGPKHGLVRFDAASLAGLEINSATLTLYLNDIANAGTVSIHAITSSWDESSVTWNNQPPSEATATAVVDLAVADEGSEISIDVTDIVQRWADGSLADGGFLLVTTDAIKAYFDAKEKVGGIPATLEVDTGPPAYSGEAIVLDLSHADNCIIDEPGYYVLDRSWLLTMENQEEPNASCAYVHITSGGVTLDLRGFSIRGGMQRLNYEPVLWIDTESSVTLRDGLLTAIFVAIEASVASDRHGVTLDRIRTGGAVLLDNRFVTVTGGRYSASMEDTLQVGEGSRVDGATLLCSDAACLQAHGSSRISNCTFEVDNPLAPAMYLSGDGTIVEGNVLNSWVGISGNHNMVAQNYFSGGGTYIEVNGTGNILDGNIGPGIVFERAGPLGFQSTGNFYGNNRVALPGSITGTDGNTDWGGNVSY